MSEGNGTKRRHRPAVQIAGRLRQAYRLLGESTLLVEVCEHLEVTEVRSLTR